MLKFDLKNDKFAQNIQSLTDNFKMLQGKLSDKAEKESLDKKLLDISGENSKSYLKLEESIKNLEIKTRTLIQKIHKNDDENKVSPQIFETLVKITRESIDNILVNNLTDHLESNDLIKKYKLELSESKDEINKIYESITSIRENLTDKNKLEDKITQIKENEFNLNMEVKVMKKKLDEIIANFEGEAHKDDENERGTSLKDQLRKLNDEIKMMKFQADNSIAELKNFKGEISDRITKEFRCIFLIKMKKLLFQKDSKMI